jgi:L-threonylcarbamoyladenylate synthase
MVIYRPGAVTAAQIQATAGAVEVFRNSAVREAKPRAPLPSPGMGLRHYAPRARLVLIEGELAELAARLAGAALELSMDQIGIMLPADVAAPAGAAAVYTWGRWSAPEDLAHRLYAGLRTLDDAGCTVILCPVPPAEGIGAAIRDRLLKAGFSG